MNNINGFSGNGYQERQSVIQRNLNNRLNYVKSQANSLKKEEELKKDNNDIRDNLKVMNHMNNTSLPQNHLKMPGNNQFK